MIRTLQLPLITLATVILYASICSAWSITEPQTEDSFRQNGVAPPLQGECDNAEKGLVTRFVEGAWQYGKCLLVSVPKINADILQIRDSVNDEIGKQDLGRATPEDLKRFDGIGHIMLANVRIHEDMIRDFADRHLFLGKTSPVLESHEGAKIEILDQLRRIGKRLAKIAAQKTNEGRANVHVEVKKPELAKVEARQPESAKAEEPKNFDRMLSLHMRLWQGSAKYREIVSSINEQGEKVRLLDKAQAIAALTQKGDKQAIAGLNAFRFRAQWSPSLKAVIYLEPEKASDSDVGSTMAFEMTNGYQNRRFHEVSQLASSGAYDNLSIRDEARRIEEGAQRFAHAMEQIENEGRTLHDQIIEEAIASHTIDESWHWSEGVKESELKRIHSLILSEYGQLHMGYYQKHYTDQIAPFLARKRQESLKDRMEKLREAQRPR